MAPTVDVNQQTAADMKAARSRTSISVQTVRSYLYGEESVTIQVATVLTSLRRTATVGPT